MRERSPCLAERTAGVGGASRGDRAECAGLCAAARQRSSALVSTRQCSSDSGGLLRFVEALEKNVDAVHGVMLVRHGKVVAEGWWAPHEAGDLHVMYSVTKSFTSTAVGFASQEGLLL